MSEMVTDGLTKEPTHANSIDLPNKCIYTEKRRNKRQAPDTRVSKGEICGKRSAAVMSQGEQGQEIKRHICRFKSDQQPNRQQFSGQLPKVFNGQWTKQLKGSIQADQIKGQLRSD